MEVLVDAVAKTCPSSFGGTSGSLFLNAIASVVAAHCAVSDDYNWPPDMAYELIGRAEEGLSYDYIVVGAGTAGSVVASRLSNIYPHSSVLLVEAGDDPGADTEIPAFFFNVQNTNNDWSYKTEPDGRNCLGFKDNSCTWNKGKGMGGSSSINAMIYIRGHPKDFDEWEQMGNDGWGYSDMKYYFELQENKFNISNAMRTQDGWYQVIDDSWKQLQYTSHNYNSHEGLIGTKKGFLLTKYGKRLNTAKVMLDEAKNLHVLKNTIVNNLILNKESNRVMGINVRHSSGSIMNISSNKEVILSAGSIATPQILMLSGIGPKKHLEEIGIECKYNLPVGQNLQDHLVLPVFLKANQNATLTPEMLNLIFLQYMSTRTGPLATIGITDYIGFIDTKNLSDHPNMQFHHLYFPKNDALTLNQYLQVTGFKNEIAESIKAFNREQDILCIIPTLLHPKSRGEILLRDANWDSRPIIKQNYLQHPDDMQSVIEAIEFIHKLEKTRSFMSLQLEILQVHLPKCSTLTFNTVPYWDCYIRHMATTVYHPVGTVKMGNDESSVVDSNLLVHGISNLRIVDASIMPKIPGANTVAATLAIAYKAVDLIKNECNHEQEL